MSSNCPLFQCSSGTISQGYYNNNEHMEVIIAPFCATSLTLQFSYFYTWEGYDYLDIYQTLAQAPAALAVFSCCTTQG